MVSGAPLGAQILVEAVEAAGPASLMGGDGIGVRHLLLDEFQLGLATTLVERQRNQHFSGRFVACPLPGEDEALGLVNLNVGAVDPVDATVGIAHVKVVAAADLQIQ